MAFCYTSHCIPFYRTNGAYSSFKNLRLGSIMFLIKKIFFPGSGCGKKFGGHADRVTKGRSFGAPDHRGPSLRARGYETMTSSDCGGRRAQQAPRLGVPQLLARTCASRGERGSNAHRLLGFFLRPPPFGVWSRKENVFFCKRIKINKFCAPRTSGLVA